LWIGDDTVSVSIIGILAIGITVILAVVVGVVVALSFKRRDKD
jgi:hypothetical protein